MSTATMWAPRDASWLRNPNIYRPKKWHALTPSGDPLCGTTLMIDIEAASTGAPCDSLRCARCVAILSKGAANG